MAEADHLRAQFEQPGDQPRSLKTGVAGDEDGEVVVGVGEGHSV